MLFGIGGRGGKNNKRNGEKLDEAIEVAIYLSYLNGKSVEAIAKNFYVSVEVIKDIIKRYEKIYEKEDIYYELRRRCKIV